MYFRIIYISQLELEKMIHRVYIRLAIIIVLLLIYIFVIHGKGWFREWFNQQIVSWHLDKTGNQIEVVNYSKIGGYVPSSLNILYKIAEKL